MSSENSSKIVDFSGKILTDDDVKKRTQELRKLVLADNKLQKFRTDDPYLLRFLHCTEFNVAVALKRMQDFCKLLLDHPDWFATTSPLDKKEEIRKNAKVMLRERDRQGRRIFVVKFGKIDANTTNPQEQTQIDEIWFESVLGEPKTQAAGISVIMDLEGYSWKLFKWLTPSNLKISSAKADLFPCKEIIYHIVNSSFLLNASIKLAWPFLTTKIKDMMKFHFENWPSLHEYVDPKVLPKQYGGTGPDIDYEKLNQWLFDQDAEIRDRLKYQRIAQK